MNSVLLVNEKDIIIGTDSKENSHLNGVLHRAFSIFIYCPQTGRFLLQKRSMSKYHSAGLWANTCCSHPISEESLGNFMKDRLREELGISIPICHINYDPKPKEKVFNYAGKFHYKAKLGRMWENEIDHVFVVFEKSDQLNISHYNPEEVADLIWESTEVIEEKYKSHPESFAVWFYPAYKIAKKLIG